MTISSSQAKARGLASFSVVPFAVLLFAILAAVVLTVFGMAQRTNEAADERNRRLVVRALTNEAVELARSLRVVIDTETQHGVFRIPSPAEMDRVTTAGGFTSIGFLLANGQLIVSGRGSAADRLIEGKLRRIADDLLSLGESPFPEEIGQQDVAGRFAAGPGGLTIGAGLLMPANAAIKGAVAIRTIDEDGLRRLGDRLSISDLVISRASGQSPTSELLLNDANGEREARLAWRPERPGTPVLESLIPIAMFAVAAIVIFGLLSYSHIRRVTMTMLTSEARARHLAGHDTLSGLPNRMLFSERLDATIARLRSGQPGIAVLFIDLDKFKEVNDTHGHAVGDRLLIMAAERMAEQLRHGDLLARFGGDEFAVLQNGVCSPHDADMLARRLIEVLKPAFQIDRVEVFIGCSIGIALSEERKADAAELMRVADIAMYRAKNEGRGRACFFEQKMDDVLRMRKAVEDDLRAAIDRDELRLHYQPQVSADGTRIVGVEALVRWQHPQHGMIPPDRFIAIAEERGLIVPLGEWVLRRACLDMLPFKNLTVAVNVSAVQFRQTDFAETVSGIIQQTGIEANRVELELTESVVVADADRAEEAIINLRAKGIRIALDDFGTGYSSLIYLRRFALDKIKLDRSFLDSLEDTGESAILVHSVVHLGRALGLTVTAEGVETDQQQRFLQAVGCHLLQGYLFSKPVPIDDFATLAAMPRPFKHVA
jgi:diguanylate cyclase